MKKRRSRKENKTDPKKEPNTPSEAPHETVEIIEELSDEPENPNDDEQVIVESEDNYGIKFDEEGMCTEPTPEFWEAWQEDKEKIKERGWWVVRDRNPTSPLWGKWLIFETQKHLRSYNYRQKKQREKLSIRRSLYVLYYDMIEDDGEDEYMWRELCQVLDRYKERGIILNYGYDFEAEGDVSDKYK